jgi:hypothetical protein
LPPLQQKEDPCAAENAIRFDASHCRREENTMKSKLAVPAALFVALCGVPRAGQPTGPVPSGPITVMTWNVYHGVDAQIMAVGQATSQADLIGVQEAILVRTQQPRDGPATLATKVELDYVQMLLDALNPTGSGR